jgi:phosphoribosylglycinamide formyltransferase-1
VLASGRGSNLQALIDAWRAGQLGGDLRVVVSNVVDAPALGRAREAGLPAIFRDHRGRRREEYDLEIQAILEEHGVDLVCLAGYVRLLSPGFIAARRGRILNVHPSLLPSFPGLDAQKKALDHGVKVSGATVHLVDEGLDSGPILLQEAVAVRNDDTAETLSARILEAEHRIYPRAVRIVLGGAYRIEGRRVILQEPS